MTTSRLALPLIAAAQAQKHVTHNEALVVLDAVVQAAALDKDLNAPPGSPADGDAYIVAASATGAWAGHDGELAFVIDGGWRFVAPFTGLRVWVADEQAVYAWDGGGWTATLRLPAGARLGIGVDPLTDFHIQSTGGATLAFRFEGEGSVNGTLRRRSNDTSAPNLFLSKGRGTLAAPTLPATNDVLGQLAWLAAISGGENTCGRLQATIIEPTPADSALGARLVLSLNPVGSATLSEIARLDHSAGLSMFGANPVIDQNRHHRLRSYTVATLPSASPAGQLVYVSNETGGAVPAFSDGTDWRRVTDRAVVS